MKNSNRLKRRLISLSAWAARVVLALTFIFSGLTKAIDPKGTALKIGDYLAYVHIQASDDLLIVVAITLCTIEFVLGVFLLLGIRRRFTAIVTLAFMALMTAFTVFTTITNPVQDCGCFGDALKLSNAETLVKNVILLACAVSFFLEGFRTRRMVSPAFHTLISGYSILFILAISLYGVYYLPLVDFRPYKVGTDIAAARNADDYTPAADFMAFDSTFNDVTDDILSGEGYKFILISPHFDKADNSTADEINALYDYCQDYNIKFWAITASDQRAVERWIYYTGAEYPILYADGTLLETIIRSNPGLLLMNGGKILAKWSFRDFPTLSQGKNLNRLEQRSQNALAGLLKILLYYLVPLLFIIFADKFWRNHKPKNTIKT